MDEDNGMELQQSVAADVATAAPAPVEVESHGESDGGDFLRQQMQHHQG